MPFLQNTPNCTCTTPLVPRYGYVPNSAHQDIWGATLNRNIELAKKAGNPDVVMLGDSVMEHWLGTELGEISTPGIHHVFNFFFRDKASRGFDGLALGIAGDHVSLSNCTKHITVYCALLTLLFFITCRLHSSCIVYDMAKCTRIFNRVFGGSLLALTSSPVIVPPNP